MGMLMMAFAASGTGCNGNAGIEGTYVDHAKGQYSIADDTLVVSKLDGQQFRVLRSTGFNLIRGDSVGKREFETEEWIIVYDQNMSAYRGVGRGKVIRYDNRTNLMLVGNRRYSKIK